MARKLYTADLHTDHSTIIRLSKRPFVNVHEMKETIITNWNNEVNDGDIVYVLGDTCFSVNELIELLENLKGQIHIIKGNHDDDAVKKAMNGYTIRNIVYHRDVVVTPSVSAVIGTLLLATETLEVRSVTPRATFESAVGGPDGTP